MADQFKVLFSPIRVGGMTAPNRIMVPGHIPGMGDVGDLLPNDRLIAYWESKAKGGAGIITTGGMGVHPSAMMYSFGQPEKTLETFKRAADAVRRHGSCFLVQLWHFGGQAYGTTLGHQPWSASAVPPMRGGAVPHEMTRDEIKEVIAAFASAAVLCQKAGCDGVELHGAHSYLFCQFMSPYTNRRTDEYGGDMEGRMRFTLETIDAVRAAVGDNYPVGIRVNGDEFIEGGYNLEDMKIMAPMMASTGKLDFIDVSTGGLMALAPMYFPIGHSVYLASAIKQVVDIPVCTIGRINDPVQAENILAEGHADIVCMNRALICDPELPRKAREGRIEEIRKCLACSEGCWQRLSQDRHPMGISCTYNPTVGMETVPGWLELIPAQTRKKVMVIGGGPAGLEAARVAAARGHQVSLWEKYGDLGGMVLLASRAPGREDLGELPRYYRYQMKLLGVDVHLGTEVTAETVKKENPDVVIVATGSVPRVPYDIKGIDQDNVVNVRQVLSGRVEVGQNVLIVDGQHHIQGMATADFLAQQGKTVELITEAPTLGSEMEMITMMALRYRLHAAGVKLTPLTQLKEISGNAVRVAFLFTGETRVLEGIDTVVLSYGGVENNELYYALKDAVKEVYSAGDCKGVRKIVWATADGAAVARTI